MDHSICVSDACRRISRLRRLAASVADDASTKAILTMLDNAEKERATLLKKAYSLDHNKRFIY